MQEEARVMFYDIKEFGFFKRSEETPAFGDIGQILRDLERWGAGKQIGLTKTFDVDGSVLPAYLVDVRRRGQAWLLTLWNETANTDGAVASMSAYADVGNSEVTMNELAEGDIPGFASYFWFLPDHQAVATVRFQHPGAGRLQMRSYVQKFMAYFCANAVTSVDDETDGIRVHGYRASATDPVIKARPRFSMELHKKHAEQQFLLESAHRIRKIKKKSTLILTERPDRALWQKLLDSAHLTEPQVRPHDVKIVYEVEVETFTQEDVAAVIEGWEDEDQAGDYGFVMQGEQETYWLGRAIAKETLMLDIVRVNPEIVDPQTLIEALAHNRTRLLSLLE
ncbi:hypothetical protein PMI15_00548 [Polaromonas sp. CF318]|uniref:hypothetical protein n=1 Tax=Polaromonas sp. CF318 TaxID=1144318 RepID=UPI000271443A|nr:hypothetical protein [Polaromonas sp. CF318]EJL89719.1 hypothetical protein PMI15_00548 [Polaromonas sp. CF318]